VVLAGGQLAAPRLAARLLSQRLAKDGRVLDVHVSAFPWLQLLWQQADHVVVRMASYTVPDHQISPMVQDTSGVGSLAVSVGVLHVASLTLHDVSLRKQGDELTGAAQLNLADLQLALPVLRSLTPVSTGAGGLVLRGYADVLGVSLAVDVVVAARDGDLVVAPAGLVGAFASLTLFADPHVFIRSVTASPVPGGIRFVLHGLLT
jgi:hypothetical protein